MLLRQLKCAQSRYFSGLMVAGLERARYVDRLELVEQDASVKYVVLRSPRVEFRRDSTHIYDGGSRRNGWVTD